MPKFYLSYGGKKKKMKQNKLTVFLSPGLNYVYFKSRNCLARCWLHLYANRLLLTLLDINKHLPRERRRIWASTPPLGKKTGTSATFLVRLQAFKMEMINFSQSQSWDEAFSSSSTSCHLAWEHNGTFLSCSLTVGKNFMKMKQVIRKCYCLLHCFHS